MARPMRAFGFIDISSGHFLSSPYICRSCRHLAWRQRLANQQSLRHASSEQVSFTEKVRRKIWAGGSTSGLEDPNDGETLLESRQKQRAREKEAQELKALEQEHATQRLAPAGVKPRALDGRAGSSYVAEGYVAAETWDGLEHIGHKGQWRDMPPQPEDEFQAFLNTGGPIPSKPEHFLAAIHQATVEIITLQQAGKDMSLSTLAKPWYPEIQDLIARTTVDILPGEASPKLIYPTEQTQGIIIGWFLKKQRDHLTKEVGSPAASVEEPHTPSQMSEIDAQEVYEVSDTWDKSRTMDRTAESMENDVYDAAEVERSVLAEDEKLAERLRREFEVQHGRDHEPRRPGPVTFFYEGLDSPALGPNQAYLDLKLNFKDELTYFLFRRITNLTGLRIPDPILAKMKTLRSIYIYQLREVFQPKPKNLAETLANRAELASLPNVKIMDRRETPVDKEKAIGRWKVIEEELRSRGLPVLGRAEV